MALIEPFKTRPNDGSEGDWDIDTEISDDQALASFLKEVEQQRQEKIEEDKKKLEKLKNAKMTDEELDEMGVRNKEKKENLRIAEQIEFSPQRKVGLFNKQGKGSQYGTEKFQKQVNRVFGTTVKRVQDDKKEKFMKLFDRYHRLKGNDISTFHKNEIIKFTQGLRSGSSDERFTKMCKELKQEGVIKKSTDLQKMFTKGEIRKIKDGLMGKQPENINPTLDSVSKNQRANTIFKARLDRKY